MKFVIAASVLLLSVVSGPTVFASWQSWTVWGANQASENGLTGTVKTIALNSEQDQMIVKIQTAKGDVEIVKICDGNIQSANNQPLTGETLDLLQGALASGKPVQLHFASAFDRCIQAAAILDGPTTTSL
jgi:hypothetical protein